MRIPVTVMILETPPAPPKLSIHDLKGLLAIELKAGVVLCVYHGYLHTDAAIALDDMERQGLITSEKIPYPNAPYITKETQYRWKSHPQTGDK
jgi:hypothetical protein